MAVIARLVADMVEDLVRQGVPDASIEPFVRAEIPRWCEDAGDDEHGGLHTAGLAALRAALGALGLINTSPPPAEPPPTAALVLIEGDAVEHPRYGFGSVIGADDAGVNAKVRVRFEKGESVTFIVSKSPLRRRDADPIPEPIPCD